MKYSFVIPTYNNKILIKNTLEAINYQKGFCSDDYEVVVVDDGSSDNTYDFIKGINKNYNLKYLYLERNENSCRARTRNHGWKNASGEIIAFIDSDIIIKPDYLFELDRCFSMNMDILVLGNRLMLDKPIEFNDIATGEVYRKFVFEKEKYEIMEYRYFLYETTSYNSNTMMLPWTQVYSCNMAVAKKNLEAVGGFDENFKKWGVEDIELGYSLYDYDVQIIINSKLEVLHQYHGERNDLIIKKEYIPGYDINLEYFLTKHPKAINMRKKYAFQYLKGEIREEIMFPDSTIKVCKINFKKKA